MWPRLRLDVGWSDLGAGLVGAAARGRPGSAVEPDELVCLSVRTALDLYLRALALPAGSEVLTSALTIPHVPAIVREHGLVPVPVDLDPRTLAPAPESLRRARTAQSRLLLVAHLFGGRVRLEPLVAFAREHDLGLVEDCAQAFVACGCAAHPDADATLYSFGTIKTATALGGAVVRVRDGRVLAEMRRIHASYPAQPSGEHARRLGRAALLKLLATRAGFGAFAALLRAGRRDLDAVLQGAVAGFPGPAPFARLRRRPSPSLERMLARRLRRQDPERLAARRSAGGRLAAALPASIERPGAEALDPTHWVFPILVPDPDRVVAALRAAGFDATRRSSLTAIEPPRGHPCGVPVAARDMLARIVFLPCAPEMPASELERLGRELSSRSG